MTQMEFPWNAPLPGLVGYLHNLISQDVSTINKDLPDGTRLSEIIVYPIDRTTFSFLENVISVVLEYKKEKA